MFSNTPKDFQTAYEGEMLCLYASNVLEKVGFCNSSPVKCSRLYGNYLTKNIIFFGKFLYIFMAMEVNMTNLKIRLLLSHCSDYFPRFFLPTLIKVVPV